MLKIWQVQESFVILSFHAQKNRTAQSVAMRSAKHKVRLSYVRTEAHP